MTAILLAILIAAPIGRDAALQAASEARLALERGADSPWADLRAALEGCVPPDIAPAIFHDGLPEEEPADREAWTADLRARLRSLKAACKEPDPTPAAGVDSDAVLREVLSREEFQQAPKDAGFWVHLGERIARWIGRLLEGLPGWILAPAVYTADRLFLVAVYLALAGTLVWFLLRETRLRRAATAPEAPATRPLDKGLLDPGGLLAEGDLLRAGGRLVEALSCYRLYALRSLEARSLLAYSPARYHRDFVTQARVSGAPDRTVRDLRDALATFDQHRYGAVPVDRGTCRRFRDRAVALAAPEDGRG